MADNYSVLNRLGDLEQRLARLEGPSAPEASVRPHKKSAGTYCGLPLVPERVLGPEVSPDRAALLIRLGRKWVNGTVLHYYFFDKDTDGHSVRLRDGTRRWISWVGPEEQRAVVRRAFQEWKDLGIGLQVREVSVREEAEIRIGFGQGDGSWSYIGRDIIDHVPAVNDRTMNLGWDLTRGDGLDTAVHEIGHTLGFPHEHQNPIAGLVWDEEAVYTALAQPPNGWSREQTYHNIIRKLERAAVRGSEWDPNSIMHYPFEAGLILEPERYRSGLFPEDGLSPMDIETVREIYPPTAGVHAELRELDARHLNLSAGETAAFSITPDATRTYTIGTFGTADTVIVLFEEEQGELRYRAGDDDSGTDTNATIRTRLIRGRKYVLRIRLYYADVSGKSAVMLW